MSQVLLLFVFAFAFVFLHVFVIVYVLVFILVFPSTHNVPPPPHLVFRYAHIGRDE